MLRAGMIMQIAAGIYNYLPLGPARAGKVETIVREEMNRAGRLEILMLPCSRRTLAGERPLEKYGGVAAPEGSQGPRFRLRPDPRGL